MWLDQFFMLDLGLHGQIQNHTLPYMGIHLGQGQYLLQNNKLINHILLSLCNQNAIDYDHYLLTKRSNAIII